MLSDRINVVCHVIVDIEGKNTATYLCLFSAVSANVNGMSALDSDRIIKSTPLFLLKGHCIKEYCKVLTIFLYERRLTMVDQAINTHVGATLRSEVLN